MDQYPLFAQPVPDWVGVIIENLGKLWQFLLDKPEAAGVIVTVLLAVIAAIWAGLVWLMPRLCRLRKRPTPEKILADTFPFEVIKPNSEKVVQQLLKTGQREDDPLADFNIPYQLRQEGCDVRQALEQLLKAKQWLLILGRTGLGKSREAAELAKILNGEGWTILRLKDGKWLDVPLQFPEETIGVRRKLLFFLDDLNRPMYSSRRREGRSREGISDELLKEPLQERLKRTLAFYEGECRSHEVLVIATARNEAIPEREGEPSEIVKLEFEKYPQFWNRFERYALPDLRSQGTEQLLQACTSQANLSADADQLGQIACRNDGTFRNVVENLIRIRSRNLVLSVETFQPTLAGSWEERYQTVVRCYPLAKAIYDAIDLLRQLDVELQPILVRETAKLLVKGWWRRWQVARTLPQLLKIEPQLLTPPDGMIEAKGKGVEVSEYLHQVTQMLLRQAQQRPGEMGLSLYGFAFAAYRLERYREALSCFNKLLAQLEKQTQDSEQKVDLAFRLHHIYFSQGTSLLFLAKEAYNSNHQDLAIKKLGKAINSFDKALKIGLDDPEVWYNRGTALGMQGQHAKAISSLERARRFKPDDADIWYSLGINLCILTRYEEAIASFDQALAIKPSYFEAWFN